jgi:hypothetical protein
MAYSAMTTGGTNLEDSEPILKLARTTLRDSTVRTAGRSALRLTVRLE